MSHLNGTFLKRLTAAAGAALVALLAVGGIALGAVEVLRAPVTPDAAALGALALALGPVVMGSGLPLAALIGVVTVASHWREEGEWLALRAAGWGGRGLLPALLIASLSVGAASWALNHRLEPAARSEIRAALREGVRPAPGKMLNLGGAAVLADAVEGDELRGLFFAREEAGGLVVGSAARGRIAGEALTLEDGELHAPGEPALAVRFETATIPLEPPKSRVELVERSDEALAKLVARMEAAGQNASYEQAVLSKRSAWPLASALMVLLALPLALSGRAWAVAAAVLAYWAAVRGFDHAAQSVGGLVAAWGPPGMLGAVTAAVWALWRER